MPVNFDNVDADFEEMAGHVVSPGATKSVLLAKAKELGDKYSTYKEYNIRYNTICSNNNQKFPLKRNQLDWFLPYAVRRNTMRNGKSLEKSIEENIKSSTIKDITLFAVCLHHLAKGFDDPSKFINKQEYIDLTDSSSLFVENEGKYLRLINQAIIYEKLRLACKKGGDEETNFRRWGMNLVYVLQKTLIGQNQREQINALTAFMDKLAIAIQDPKNYQPFENYPAVIKEDKNLKSQVDRLLNKILLEKALRELKTNCEKDELKPALKQAGLHVFKRSKNLLAQNRIEDHEIPQLTRSLQATSNYLDKQNQGNYDALVSQTNKTRGMANSKLKLVGEAMLGVLLVTALAFLIGSVVYTGGLSLLGLSTIPLVMTSLGIGIGGLGCGVGSSYCFFKAKKEFIGEAAPAFKNVVKAADAPADIEIDERKDAATI